MAAPVTHLGGSEDCFSPASAVGGLESLRGLALQIEDAIVWGRIPEAKEVSRTLYGEGRLHIARAVLENRHANPLPVAESLVKSLSCSEIQFEDELKAELAQTARLFIELTAFKCSQERRPLYSSTVESLRESLTTIHDALKRDKNPHRQNDQVLLLFNVTCCLEAVKSMDSIDYGGLFEDLISIILEQSVETASSRIKILQAQLGKNWFADLLYISWLGSVCDADLPTFTSLESDIVRLSQKSPEIALGSVEVCFDLIQRGSPAIKRRAFQGLIQLANLRGTIRSGTFWKVRYRAIQHLSVLTNHADRTIGEYASCTLLHLNSREKKKEIRSLFELLEKDPQIIENWKQQFADIVTSS